MKRYLPDEFVKNVGRFDGFVCILFEETTSIYSSCYLIWSISPFHEQFRDCTAGYELRR
jgi:hypothetical protein